MYMASYEHDWEDAGFEFADYKVGLRDVGGRPIEVPQPEHSPRPTPKPPRPARKVERNAIIDLKTEAAQGWVLEDPAEDPVTFTDPPNDIPNEPFPNQAEDTALDIKTFKGGTAYGKRGLWSAYKDSGNQPGQHPTP